MKKCRECGATLVVGENWYPSRAKKYDYICILCHKACSHQWYVENKEEKAAYNRKWVEKNPEYFRQWYEEHREECLALMRQRRKDNPSYMYEWREEHGEEIAAYNREYYAGHKGEIKARARQWKKENPEKNREQSRRYRARKADVTIDSVDEQKIYELSGNACFYCGGKEDLSLDHVVPLSGGGAHAESNLVVACRSCNSSKHNTPLEEWLQTQPYSQAWLM